ncbi:MAG: winged helix-turn-helix domain-containing protein [Candidatus Hermodarchaeota archaeon]
MNNIDKIDLKNIEIKLEEFSKNITFLQDLALTTKIKLDDLAKNIIEKNFLSEITQKTEKDLVFFLDNRPANCKILDSCTVMIEKATIKVLRTYIDKGALTADKLVDKYIEFSTKPNVVSVCPNENCFNIVLNLFKTLKELLHSAKQFELKNISDIYKDGKFLDKLEESEGESDLISPLSNEKRIKILKILSKGSLYYNQIEDNVGIKGGPFHFHLKKLLDANFIKQTEEKGPYSITFKGLKALKFLFDFKEVLSNLE